MVISITIDKDEHLKAQFVKFNHIKWIDHNLKVKCVIENKNNLKLN